MSTTFDTTSVRNYHPTPSTAWPPCSSTSMIECDFSSFGSYVAPLVLIQTLLTTRSACWESGIRSVKTGSVRSLQMEGYLPKVCWKSETPSKNMLCWSDAHPMPSSPIHLPTESKPRSLQPAQSLPRCYIPSSIAVRKILQQDSNLPNFTLL